MGWRLVVGLLLSAAQIGCVANLDLTKAEGGYAITCDAGECPGGLVCVSTIEQCRRAGSACIEDAAGGWRPVANGNECVLADGAAGLCVSGNCVGAGCGDGFVGSNEGCDNGAENSDVRAGACRTDCQPARCGDAVIDNNEQCDDGVANSDIVSDACRSDCRFARCGDGTTDTLEGCDDGALNANDADCTKDCVPARCGDGLVHTGVEACDAAGESGLCDVDCTPALCGDGKVNAARSEQCDEGAVSATCNANCTSAQCGDGVVNALAGEDCDTGGESRSCNANCQFSQCGDFVVNMTAGEGCDAGGETFDCNANCTIASCGDGVRNLARQEQCDAGQETAVCDDDCSFAACGDGKLNSVLGESCDAGPTSGTPTRTNTALCDADCTTAACGDFFVNPVAGEVCDFGGSSAADSCNDEGPSKNCRVTACGDSLPSAGEQCDDGDDNVNDVCPDGTHGTCQNAFCSDGYVCSDAACTSGAGSAPEQCDDHDLSSGDGCSSTCVVEAGYACSQANPWDQSDCAPVCGNGLTHSPEQCDAGPTVGPPVATNSPSCDSNCTSALCGDAFVNAAAGEQCDGMVGGNASCTGQCLLSCSSGRADCDGASGTGCECTMSPGPLVKTATMTSTGRVFTTALRSGAVVTVGPFTGSITFGAQTLTAAPSSTETFVVKHDNTGAVVALTRIGLSGRSVLPFALSERTDGVLLVWTNVSANAVSTLSQGNRCVGGANAGAVCALHSDCSGGACGLSLSVADGQTLVVAAFDSSLAPINDSGTKPRRVGFSANAGNFNPQSAAVGNDGRLFMTASVCELQTDGFCQARLGDTCVSSGGVIGATGCTADAQCSGGTCGVRVVDYPPASAQLVDGLVASYTAAGRVEWVQSVVSSARDEIVAVKALADGRAIIAGSLCSGSCSACSARLGGRCAGGSSIGAVCVADSDCPSSTCASGATMVPTACGDAFVAKLDVNGSVLWAKSGGRMANDGSSDQALALAVRPDGVSLLAGAMSGVVPAQFGSLQTLALNGVGNSSYLVAHDTNGTPLWMTHSAGVVTALATLPDGGSLVSATSNGANAPYRFGNRCVGGSAAGAVCGNDAACPPSSTCSAGLSCFAGTNQWNDCASALVCPGGSCGGALSLAPSSADNLFWLRLSAAGQFLSTRQASSSAGNLYVTSIAALLDGQGVYAGYTNAASTLEGQAFSPSATSVFVVRSAP